MPTPPQKPTTPKQPRAKKARGAAGSAEAARDEYPVQTNPETNAMLCAASDGKKGRYWQTVLGADIRVHQVPGASHRVQLMLDDGERQMGIPVEALAGVTDECDADDDFIFLYVSRQIAPVAGVVTWAKIELDDVIKSVGWEPRTALQRAEMRRRVWQFLKFVARAHVVGQRTYKVRKDRITGEEFETYISSPCWALGDRESDMRGQISLFGEDEPPLSIDVIATAEWARVALSPQMAQFLPLGEVLGAIPGGKPAGAWARVIGLALANFWRRNPKDAISGKLKPTRRELLERYTPSTGTVAEILKSAQSTRAIEYWSGALEILVQCDFLAPVGEAAASYEELRDALPLRYWQDEWLNGVIEIKPGAELLKAIQERADALPQAPKIGRKTVR